MRLINTSRVLRPVPLTVLLLVALLLPLGPALAGGRSQAGGVPPTDPETRPNVVLITTDDQTLADLAHMPLTRRLIGGEGATFKQMVSPHPLCCPARAEILTGQFAQNNGVKTNKGRYGGYPALRDPDDVLPRWLLDAGYETAMIGKFLNRWHPEEVGTPPGWTDFHAFPGGGEGYYDFEMYANGQTTSYSGDRVYSSSYVTDTTVARIEQWSSPATDRAVPAPFFIWSSYYAPHGECGEATCKVPPVPEEKFAGALSGVESPALTKPSYDGRLRRANRVVAGREVVDRDFSQHFFTERIRSLQSVDEGVGRIVAALSEAGVLDDTLLLFTSDNGYLLGEHRYVGKVVAYEESLRVPLLVRGPGIPEGSVRRQLATTVDLAPTILDAAGAEPGRTVDGRSLLPLARTGATAGPTTDTTLIQAGIARESRGSSWMYRGVRTKRWTYTRWPSPGRGPEFAELFDRRSDPHQQHNLAGRRRFSAVEKELSRRARRLQRCAGVDQCFRDFGRVPQVRR